MKIFTDEGVEPRKVQLAHTGDTDDLDHIEALLATGAWIGLDRFGIDLFLPDDRRMPTFVELVRRATPTASSSGATRWRTWTGSRPSS